MGHRTAFARLLLLPLAAVLLAACAHRQEDPLPDSGQAGYYEASRDGALYVVSSIRALDDVEAGRMLGKTVTFHSAQGQAVVIEAPDAATEARLRAEYMKRHPQR